jgi:hypothetical protein
MPAEIVFSCQVSESRKMKTESIIALTLSALNFVEKGGDLSNFFVQDLEMFQNHIKK